MNYETKAKDRGVMGTRVEADGSVHNVLTVAGSLDEGKAETELWLPGGDIVRMPTAFLMQTRGVPAASAGPGAGVRQSFGGRGAEELGEMRVIPVVEERLEVTKRTVTTGRVRVEKQVQEYHETLDVPLAVRSFDVERVVKNEPVESAPAVRQEGDTTIYPLVEEQLVLTTRLILKEELRVTKRDTERRDTRTVTLKRESVSVTRMAPEEGDRGFESGRGRRGAEGEHGVESTEGE